MRKTTIAIMMVIIAILIPSVIAGTYNPDGTAEKILKSTEAKDLTLPFNMQEDLYRNSCYINIEYTNKYNNEVMTQGSIGMTGYLTEGMPQRYLYNINWNSNDYIKKIKDTKTTLTYQVKAKVRQSYKPMTTQETTITINKTTKETTIKTEEVTIVC